jgi:putative DNA-invertase from lambdoid prophage Rac
MILGYSRVSSADQAKDGRSSLDTQSDVIEGYARTRGIDRWGVQIYTDAGVSGAVKLSFRPAGEQLLKDMKAGDTVIASKLDRMFRSATDAIAMFDVFKAKGVDLVLFDISHEPVSAGVGKLIMTILAAVADMERVRIKERTAEGRKAKKAKGGAVGEVPFGYTKVGEGRTAVLIPNEKELRALAMARELFQAKKRLGYRQIGAMMAGDGLVSRTGNPYTPWRIRQMVEQETVQ